jgi:hypothetical protein
MIKLFSPARLPLLVILLAGGSVAAPAALADGCDRCSAAHPAAPADPAAWLARAKAGYPLDTCVVSGEKLAGGMGSPVDYVYQEPGKPDRLVRFCCKGCIKDFKKDPAQYLKKIDAADAAGRSGN